MRILAADDDGSRARGLSAQLEAQDDAFTVILAQDRKHRLDAARRTATDAVPVPIFIDDAGAQADRARAAKPVLPRDDARTQIHFNFLQEWSF